MMLFVIICVVVLSSLVRPRPYYSWYNPMFGYRRHRPMYGMHMGYRPMYGHDQMHGPMGGHHMNGHGPMGTGHRH